MGSSVTTLTVIKGLPENLFQPRIVYAKTAARSFDHLLARDTTPLDGQPVAEAEFSDELPLRSPVSITKRMNGVHLTKVAGRPNGEVFEVTAREMPFALQFSAQLIEARNNVLVECERGRRISRYSQCESLRPTRTRPEKYDDGSLEDASRRTCPVWAHVPVQRSAVLSLSP